MPRRELRAAECSEEDMESCCSTASASSSSEDEASDAEAGPGSSGEESPRGETRSSPRKAGRTRPCSLASIRAVAVGAALGLVTVYAGVQLLSAPRPLEPGWPTDITARMLLESEELADLAAEQLMAAGSGALGPEDRPMVRQIAAHGFGNISAMLKRGAPAAARRLDSYYLTKEQKAAVLGVVRGIGDRRVQSIGEEMTASLKDFMSANTADRRNMKEFIVGRLRPRMGEIRQLRDQVIGAPLRNLRKDAARHFGLELDADRLRVVNTFDDGSHWEFAMSPPERSRTILAASRRLGQEGASDLASKRLGVAGGIAEQAKVVIDQLKAIAGDTGTDLEVPQWITTLDGHVKPFISDLFGCVMEARDTAKMIECPVKFASAGIDVLAGVEGQ